MNDCNSIMSRGFQSATPGNSAARKKRLLAEGPAGASVELGGEPQAYLGFNGDERAGVPARPHLALVAGSHFGCPGRSDFTRER
jgi:hypothetical protein